MQLCDYLFSYDCALLRFATGEFFSLVEDPAVFLAGLSAISLAETHSLLKGVSWHFLQASLSLE